MPHLVSPDPVGRERRGCSERGKRDEPWHLHSPEGTPMLAVLLMKTRLEPVWGGKGNWGGKVRAVLAVLTRLGPHREPGEPPRAP